MCVGLEVGFFGEYLRVFWVWSFIVKNGWGMISRMNIGEFFHLIYEK